MGDALAGHVPELLCLEAVKVILTLDEPVNGIETTRHVHPHALVPAAPVEL
jgi:hypothetical protein